MQKRREKKKAMYNRELGLRIEPDITDEAFETLADAIGDRVFTFDEGVEVIQEVLGCTKASAEYRLNRLIENGNVG